ncbi:hypothetical protein AB0B91_65665, partial [Nonomuraea sp. NPDC049141]
MRGQPTDTLPGSGSEAGAGAEAIRPEAGPDLAHHGDAEVGPGLVDLAVNVRRDAMPDWLADPITAALGDLAAY